MRNLKKILVLMMISIMAIGLVGCGNSKYSEQAAQYIKIIEPMLKEYDNLETAIEKEKYKESISQEINKVYRDYNNYTISSSVVDEVYSILNDYEELLEVSNNLKEKIVIEQELRSVLEEKSLYTMNNKSVSGEDVFLEFKDKKSVLYGNKLYEYKLNGNEIVLGDISEKVELIYSNDVILLNDTYNFNLFAKNFDLVSYLKAKSQFITDYANGNMNIKAPVPKDYFDRNIIGIDLNQEKNLNGYGLGWQANGYYGEYYFTENEYLYEGKSEGDTGKYEYDGFNLKLTNEKGNQYNYKVFNNTIYKNYFEYKISE